MSERVGDLAIVLHSHMPYVEGFGTYPFGEEWLFDAVIRSYVPVCEAADRLTMTVTPVLADQLEAPRRGERLRRFPGRHRIGAAARDLGVGRARVPAAPARPRRALPRALWTCSTATERSPACLPGARRCRGPGGADRFERRPTRCCRCWPRAGRHRPPAGRDRSRARTAGASAERGGFWLPECAYAPGLEGHLARTESAGSASTRARHESPGEALAPVSPPKPARLLSRSTGRRSPGSGT